MTPRKATVAEFICAVLESDDPSIEISFDDAMRLLLDLGFRIRDADGLTTFDPTSGKIIFVSDFSGNRYIVTKFKRYL